MQQENLRDLRGPQVYFACPAAENAVWLSAVTVILILMKSQFQFFMGGLFAWNHIIN